MTRTQSRILMVLSLIDSKPDITQRALAQKVQLGLGTTNELIQLLVGSKMIQLSRINGRTIYRLTPAGHKEKNHLLSCQARDTVENYAALRDRILGRIKELKGNPTRVVLCGAGALAEIAYVALAQDGIQLMGVVDDERAGEQFFGHQIAHEVELAGGALHGLPFDLVIVARWSLTEVRRKLKRLNIAPSQVFTLFAN